MSEEVVTQFVYLDAADIVVANSSTDVELTAPKLVALGAVTKIANAPIEVKRLGQPYSDYYHKKISGDGTQLADYETLEYLAWRQEKRYQEIDAKTEELIKAGFVWNSKEFSLSDNAQSNWTGLVSLLTSGLLPDPAGFPVTVTTKENDKYEVSNGTELLQIAGTIFTTISGHLTTGRDLKKLILDATSLAEIDAVIDDR